ncbi:hypothetical protein BV22DRAFT_1094380 [Leucogyrophana mollusca]|uniref:Uncharacterized protein n=1 Tax=Leucogyrophana mollusca TaxID=85980 RepID=A0ACB8BA61_9AGAM|nr:hypothetical protein BV22DRAFT_1094380 [Leucogyrophana mollusca]
MDDSEANHGGAVVSNHPDPSANVDLIFSVTSRSWRGLLHITRVIVFGDSTSYFDSCVTWLAHFLKSVNKSRDVDLERLQASNYAVPGSTVEDDMSDQISRFFAQFPKKSGPESNPSLDPAQTLYVLWLGINDCGLTDEADLEEIVDKLFDDGLDEMYIGSGARNFLLIDVPPIDRSPSALESGGDVVDRYLTWNRLLKSRIEAFASDNKNASVILFSVHSVITAILDDPTKYGFQEEDVTDEGGGIWLDELHFTSDVHSIIAQQLERALDAV